MKHILFKTIILGLCLFCITACNTETNDVTTIETVTQNITESTTVKTETQQTQDLSYLDEMIGKEILQNGEIKSIDGTINMERSYKQRSIEPQDNPLVKVEYFRQPASKTFEIVADGPISNVTYWYSDDKSFFYVYLYNADRWISNYIYIQENDAVKQVRGSTISKTEMQVSFEMKNDDIPILSLSEDRNVLTVDFGNVTLEKLDFQTKDSNDSLKLFVSDYCYPVVSTEDKKIIIDLPDTFSKLVAQDFYTDANHIYHVENYQLDENTVRTVLHLTKDTQYYVFRNEDNIEVLFTSPEDKIVEYIETENLLRLKKAGDASIFNDIENVIDDYCDNRYTIKFGSLYNDYIQGEYIVGDEALSSFNIVINEGRTQIVFNEKNIYAYEIEEDKEYIYLKLLNPKEVYDKVVVVDAGHGDFDLGATYSGIREKNITLDIALKLEKLLEGTDIKVYLTRNKDEFVTLSERAKIASFCGDILLSIHNNANGSSNQMSGIEVYYPNPNTDNGAKSKALAKYYIEGLASSTGLREHKANQAIGYELTLLMQSKVPACLTEIGFLSTADERNKLNTEEFRQKAAEGLKNSLINIFEENNFRKASDDK